MAGSLNHVQIIGNLTRDPELRQTPSGQAVCTIGVATNRTWRNRDTGETQEQVEFHNIVCWGKLAEIVAQYLKKGRQAYFDGRLQTRTWDDESGKKNYRTEIVAENMIMLGGAAGSTRGGEGGHTSSAPEPQSAPEEEIRVEDLPF